MGDSTPNNTNNSENPQNTSSINSWRRAEEATRAMEGILRLNQLPLPPEKKGELMFQQALKAYQKNRLQTFNMSDEKEPLWICPKCKHECIELVCSGCTNYRLISAMNLHLREEFIKNVRGDIWKKIATGIGFAAFILLFAGIPLGGAMMQGFANLKDTGHIIAPKAAPTPLVLSPEIAQSVSQYLAANWQGWEFAGYDNESSVINYDEKDFRPTVILTKDTHRLRVNLRLIPATKDNVTTWETISDVPVTEDASSE